MQQKWVAWLIEDINSEVKSQDVAEAERSIEYLKQQIASTSLADLQVMFFELIQTQTETVMLTQVRPEYVFKTIDPAVIPEYKSSPDRTLISVFGMILRFGSCACSSPYYLHQTCPAESLKTEK